MTLQTIIFIITLGSSIQAFKILVFYPHPSFSHQQPIIALTERLVQKGHELFVVSPFGVPGMRTDNYTFVDVSFTIKKFKADEAKDGAFYYQKQMSKWDFLSQATPVFPLVIKSQFLSEPFLKFQRRVKADQIKFDITIMEMFYTPHACAMSRFLAGNAPIISMSTVQTDYYAEDPLGSILHLSYVPSILNSYTDEMSLWQKLENWFSEHYIKHRSRNLMENAARTFFRETYNDEALVDSCWTNASLSLITSNHLYFYPRLLGPNVIELGPMHIKPTEKLPKNLQDWLDSAEKGVIYFSLGQNMKSKSLAEDVRLNFLRFFSELLKGYRVLWKWELGDEIPGQSDNILAQKWIPQQSVLAHPKVRVFITQGGLQSFQEAVHNGVPMVGIPWFFDQECNVAKMVDVEIGVRLRPQELQHYQNIKAAIESVLYDDRYLKNMKKYSAISHDFTSQSLGKAVFWVEHVARHGGASHLRPSTADTTYFQFFCLDIISVIIAISCVFLYIIYSISKCLILIIFQKSISKIKRS